MQIEGRSAEEAEILELHGRAVGLREAAMLRERVNEALVSGPAVIVVDLRHVARMDSGFLGQLLVSRERALEARCELRLVAGGVPLDTLRMSGLHEVFDLFETSEAAMEPPDPAEADGG